MAKMNLNVGIPNLKHDNNILDVTVPPQLKRRISTNIEWFDDAVGGNGLTPSVGMLLTGTPGAGKTTLMLQLAESLTAIGHKVLFNTGEESLYQVRNVCDRLRFKHGFVAGQDIMSKDIIDNAIKLNDSIKGQRTADGSPKQMFLLIDSLQCMNDGYYADGGTTGNTGVRVTEQLLNFAKATFAIVIAIGHVTKSGKFAGKNTIKHAFDIHAHLFIDDDKKSETWGERIFEVQKNRWGCNGRSYILGMEERGLYKKGQFHVI